MEATIDDSQETQEGIAQQISNLKRQETDLKKKADAIAKMKSEPKRAMALEDLKEDLQKLHRDIQALNYGKQLNEMSDGIVLIAERLANMDKKLDDSNGKWIEKMIAPLPQPTPTDTAVDEEDEKPKGIRGIFGIQSDDKKVDDMAVVKPITSVSGDAPSIAMEVALLKRKVAYMAILGAVFFIATFLLLGVNAYAAIATVLLAAFFIFKFLSSFGKLNGISRQVAVNQANAIRMAELEKASKEAAERKAKGEPETHWERE